MSLFAGFQERFHNPTTQININELRARENFTEIENAPGSLCAGGGQTLGGHVRLVPTGDRTDDKVRRLDDNASGASLTGVFQPTCHSSIKKAS